MQLKTKHKSRERLDRFGYFFKVCKRLLWNENLKKNIQNFKKKLEKIN